MSGIYYPPNCYGHTVDYSENSGPATDKLYYFQPESYGMEYYVLAASEEEARQFLRDDAAKDGSKYSREEKLDAANGKGKVFVFGRGEVCKSEIC